jgi:general secretion pathway protein G
MVNNQTGVTLMEMIATLAIISILATGILPLSQIVYKRTKEMELKNNLRTIRRALDAHKTLVDEKVIPVGPGASGYPETLEIMVEGVDLKTATSEKRKFLRRVPKDPMVEDGQWGLRSYADDSQSTIWGSKDVYDIYSLSDKQAIDGSSYKDW